MDFIAIGDTIVIEPESESKTAAGIYVQKSVEGDDLQTGSVVAVGKGRFSEALGFLGSEFKEGDKVMCQFARKFTYKGKIYLLVSESDVKLKL